MVNFTSHRNFLLLLSKTSKIEFRIEAFDLSSTGLTPACPYFLSATAMRESSEALPKTTDSFSSTLNSCSKPNQRLDTKHRRWRGKLAVSWSPSIDSGSNS